VAKDAIAVVNPANGSVEGIIDLSGLRKMVKNNSRSFEWNCIQPKTGTIFVTGKTGIKYLKSPFLSNQKKV
jgi:glutamine cyclotransferase